MVAFWFPLSLRSHSNASWEATCSYRVTRDNMAAEAMHIEDGSSRSSSTDHRGSLPSHVMTVKHMWPEGGTRETSSVSLHVFSPPITKDGQDSPLDGDCCKRNYTMKQWILLKTGDLLQHLVRLLPHRSFFLWAKITQTELKQFRLMFIRRGVTCSSQTQQRGIQKKSNTRLIYIKWEKKIAVCMMNFYPRYCSF